VLCVITIDREEEVRRGETGDQSDECATEGDELDDAQTDPRACGVKAQSPESNGCGIYQREKDPIAYLYLKKERAP
jgi:hypothetical protein